MKPQNNYHHGDLRRALMDACCRLVEQRGVHALSLREAAREAGVSHAAPYAHFRDKEDLVAAIKDEGFTQLKQALALSLESTRSEKSGRLRMQALALTYLKFAREQRALFSLMFRRPLARPPGPDFNYIRTGVEIFEYIRDEVAGFVRAETGRVPADAAMTAMAAWSMLHGLLALWEDGPLRHVAGGDQGFEQVAAAQIGWLLDRMFA